MVGVRGPELFEMLSGTGIEGGGFLSELVLNDFYGKPSPRRRQKPERNEAVVIESESTRTRTKDNTKSGFGQAEKYLQEGGFNLAYSAGPLCKREHDRVGTISFHKNGKLFFNKAERTGNANRTVDFVRKFAENLVSRS
ncbi:hypothetical protein AKJ62_03740 [candidate division MSBL1 archaeon SCGC-AAA259D14]|uniref:Uncharacterized protein n=1 Tax=candidate division MSBL1 archaeon SCGC-AAA259D14 TaxID=1698261 RepID=A0A133U4M8_9EURY|nr:hypothetical protein AKJ62_03740 [candidate division MSBL1 archaeon SCGC-AAA259D14]